MINFGENKVSPEESTPHLDKFKQKEPETQEILAEDEKGESEIIHFTPKVEKEKWESREQIIQEIKEYFDAFVKYILKDGYKREAISNIALYPEEHDFVWIHKDGGYTRNLDCPLYKEYKDHNSRAAVNDFNSLIFRLWGLHSEDEQEDPISKIGDYFVSVSKAEKDKKIKACIVYMSKEELMKSIEMDKNIEKKYPDLYESMKV